MLLGRRAVLAYFLTPLVPSTPRAERDHLASLGAELNTLRHEVEALACARHNPAGWTTWNKAFEATLALAGRISTTPASDLESFAIKLDALAWEWCDDLEEHQLDRLNGLANEMRLSAT